ncbi:hypothetical protein HPB51_006393 [Rhipicephalus microplus]|uniref:Uncharacterized protein n=1 Tax=Rhipicephalus microplus TaxID=6941 RepID=A0A9J6DLY5_RHIMP|nr:hypothetical protein HPB51_006393 [Rhipicephalus microplus]
MFGTSSSTLVDELVAPATQVRQARMMGQTNTALVTLKGLKVPRYVHFYGAELHCYPHHPRQVVRKICLSLGHRDDHYPTPDVVVCPTWSTDNLTQSHPRIPHWKSCVGLRPTTDSNCPRRERQTLNKTLVRKALENDLRELQPSSDHTVSSKTAETRHSRTPMKAEESRSKSRSNRVASQRPAICPGPASNAGLASNPGLTSSPAPAPAKNHGVH